MIEDLWYKNVVIYSLDLETYMDSDGDGIGDFEGLIRRLDYLQFLGVGAIWLAPFHPSPNRDNGYDVADYYGVHERYGSSGDFVEFVHQARRRGMRVMMDLVVNHTSDEHPWFQEAREKGSHRRDWYVWSKKRPPNWDKGMVFPGQQESTWTYDRKARAYYFHRFYKFQPDLNVDNPEVRDEIRRIVGFWLQLGVEGFRVDAVPFLIESVEPGEETYDRHFEYLAELRTFMQWRKGDAILLGEANVLPDATRDYFGGEGGSDGIHMMFNFWVNQHLFYALATGEVKPLAEALEATRDIPHTAQWAHFLRNHDELDLGRLTDEQREKVFARFGPEENMQIFKRGIRRRLAPMLGDPRQERFAYSVMFSLPGTPVIRYGDELGMGDNLDLEERNAVRTPMQWANEPHAGFSTAEKTVHPVIDEGVWSYERVNVAAQRRDPDSLLNWTAWMIRLRTECPEIGWGSFEILDTGSPHVLAIRYDWRGNSVLVIHNFDDRPHEIHLGSGIDGTDRLSNLIEEEEIHRNEDGSFSLALPVYGYRWFRPGGLNYAVHRRMSDEVRGGTPGDDG